MKKLIIMIILILEIGDRAYPTEVFVHHNDSRVHFLYHRQKLIKSIAYVESRHNHLAVNVKENAVGLLQIRQIRLDDYEQRTGIKYSLDEMYDKQKSIEVFSYYADRTGWDNVEKIARCWNGGAKGMEKIKTKEYFLKVHKFYLSSYY